MKKPVWKCFIPLMILVPVFIIIILMTGTYEINSFYNNPDHIGFAIPIGTFFLAFVFLVITVIVLIICLIWASKRNKANNRCK